MPYNIEVLSLGEDSNAKIAEAAQILNAVQQEFRFDMPPPRLRDYGGVFLRQEYLTQDVWEFLKKYRQVAMGHRPYVIAVVNGALRSKRYKNLFGSHSEAMAVVTLRDHHYYADSHRSFLCYYLIRYALSFIPCDLKAHADTRNCFFDFKAHKRDLEKSLASGAFCSACAEKLAEKLNPDTKRAIDQMISVMKAQHATSKAELPAETLKASTDSRRFASAFFKAKNGGRRPPIHPPRSGEGLSHRYGSPACHTSARQRTAIARVMMRPTTA